MDFLRPQSHAHDVRVQETCRISVLYDEETSHSVWTKALTAITMELEEQNIDLAVELIDKAKFPRLYSHGLEDTFEMTHEEWDSIVNATIAFLTKRDLPWTTVFVVRLGTSPIWADNPPTLVITTPNPGLIRPNIPRLVQAMDTTWITDVYPALCLKPFTGLDAKSLYRHDQLEDHPNIGLGCSVGVSGDSGKSTTLGGTLDLVYEDGRCIRAGLTNCHLLQSVVKNTDSKSTLRLPSSERFFFAFIFFFRQQ
jgi:hypothetical protein